MFYLKYIGVFHKVHHATGLQHISYDCGLTLTEAYEAACHQERWRVIAMAKNWFHELMMMMMMIARTFSIVNEDSKISSGKSGITKRLYNINTLLTILTKTNTFEQSKPNYTRTVPVY